jgi:hypothetical protein
LGALDRDGRATAHGRAIAALPLHPRLGHMLLRGRGGTARAMAALLAARPGAAGAATDLRDRLAPLLRPAGDGAAPGLAAIRDAARQLPEPQGAVADPDELAALAYPDRIALRRADGGARYLLSGGKGARLEPGDPLCRERLLVATDLDGDATEARIRAAIPIAETALRGVLGDRIAWQASCVWDRRARRVVARVQERLGALVLDDRPWQDCPPERIAAAALDGVRDLGLGALQRSRAALALIDRAGFLRGRGAALPDLSDAALIARAGDWLLPFLAGCRSAEDLARRDIAAPLAAWLGPATLHQIDRLAPAHFTAPSGRRVAIDYAGGRPAVAIRLQELFGLDVHPTVGPDAEPLVLTLLSPAGRPVQTTADLPGEEVEDVFRVIGRNAPAQHVEIRLQVGDQREVLRPRQGREVRGDPDLGQHADGGLADRLVVDVAVVGAVELDREPVAIAGLRHQGARGLDVIGGVCVHLRRPAIDRGGAITPAGCDWPRITTCWIASRLMARFHRLAHAQIGEGVGALHVFRARSSSPTFIPKKITRFCGAVARPMPSASSRAEVLHRHVLDEVDLARQKRRDAGRGVLDRGEDDLGQAAIGNCPCPSNRGRPSARCAHRPRGWTRTKARCRWCCARQRCLRPRRSPAPTAPFSAAQPESIIMMLVRLLGRSGFGPSVTSSTV